MSAQAETFTGYSTADYPRLLLDNGDLDLATIAREIARRCGEGPGETIERRRLYWERHVLAEAAYQQWPFVEALIPGEWNETERAEYDFFANASRLRAGREANEFRTRAEAIRQAVVQRAIARFHRSILN